MPKKCTQQPATRPHAISFNPEEGKTQQSFLEECNINSIMKKFQKTGAINHYMAYSPQYGEHTQNGLMEAMDIVIQAETMFDDLPSSLRKEFHNDPGEFLKFVEDPDNRERMRELGLVEGRESDLPVFQNMRRRAADLQAKESESSSSLSSPEE